MPISGVISDVLAGGADRHETAQFFNLLEMGLKFYVFSLDLFENLSNFIFLCMQTRKYGHFAAQRQSINRFEQIVNGSGLVSLKNIGGVGA